MVNDDQVSPSNSKTYTQHDLDKLRTHWEEQFKLQKAIDKKILEKEIQNHYLHQIQSLKSEHQEQLATMASEITAHKDNLSQLMHKKHKIFTPFKCSNKELVAWRSQSNSGQFGHTFTFVFNKNGTVTWLSRFVYILNLTWIFTVIPLTKC